MVPNTQISTVIIGVLVAAVQFPLSRVQKALHALVGRNYLALYNAITTDVAQLDSY